MVNICSYIKLTFSLMRKRLGNVLTLIIFFFSSVTLMSQDIKSFVELDTDDILIGDHIHLRIYVSAPKENKIIWPVFSDTLSKDIEILEKSDIDTIEQDNTIYTYTQRLKLIIFDSGYYYIPPIRFYYNSDSDTALYYFESDPIPLTVSTIHVDTSQDIKDIKDPLTAPLTFMEVLPWILIALAVAVFAYFIYYYLRRRKQEKPLLFIKPKPKIPPHRKALDDLEKLKAEKLWQNGKVKDYHTRLTDIIRIYIEERYSVMAVEMTTNEIIDGLQRTGVGKTAIEKLNHILVLADFVKFAKLQPLPLEHDMSFNNAVDFVKETMQRIVDKTNSEENTENTELSEFSDNDKDELIEK